MKRLVVIVLLLLTLAPPPVLAIDCTPHPQGPFGVFVLPSECRDAVELPDTSMAP